MREICFLSTACFLEDFCDETPTTGRGDVGVVGQSGKIPHRQNAYRMPAERPVDSYQSYTRTNNILTTVLSTSSTYNNAHKKSQCGDGGAKRQTGIRTDYRYKTKGDKSQEGHGKARQLTISYQFFHI